MSTKKNESLVSEGRSEVKYCEIVSLNSAGVKNGSNQLETMVFPVNDKVSVPYSNNAMESSQQQLHYGDAKVQIKKYRSRMTAVAALAMLMTVVVIVLAVLLGLGVGGDDCVSPPVVTASCKSQECITAAARILNSLDRSVEPCTDFFTYSCGKWNNDHLIPEDKSSVSTFNDVRDSVSKTLKAVLEKDSTGDRDSIKKAKTFYAACMDTTSVNNAGGQPALDLITEMGGMPLFGDPLNSSFSLEVALGQSMGKFASNALVTMYVSSDDKNSSVNIMKIDQPSLGMPSRDYYIDGTRRNSTMPGYMKYMQDYLSLLWKAKDEASFNQATVNAAVDQIIDLETQIASIMAAQEDRRDSFAIYRKRTITAMGTEVNADFDWSKYINAALNFVGKTVDGSREVVSYGDPYLKNFTKILSTFDNSVTQNYIVWLALNGRVPYLGKEYRDTQAPYRLAVSGTQDEKARWETCSGNANTYFQMPVGALFVEAAFPAENKAVTLTMVENIRKAFIGFLPGNEWMDQPTKDRAEEKAGQIEPIIAYPDYILETDNPKMDDDFAGAVVAADTYFMNIQTMVFFATKKNMNKLDVPVDRTEWITGPAIVNAFYSPTRNQIVFPAGILQPPFYDPGQPNSMNYGGIGMVIGHEITHGFDDSGSQYNGIGNLENWWSDASRTNFDTKAKCMSTQYSSYYWETAGENLNGDLTLGENIADNGGIREAFDAYLTWRETNEQDLLLPGLEDFTQEQLFFLSMAQVWCGTYREEYAKRLVSTDSHSPGIYRVIGSLSNFDEFGKAYGCKQGMEAMYPNPEDTCRVW